MFYFSVRISTHYYRPLGVKDHSSLHQQQANMPAISDVCLILIRFFFLDLVSQMGVKLTMTGGLIDSEKNQVKYFKKGVLLS